MDSILTAPAATSTAVSKAPTGMPVDVVVAVVVAAGIVVVEVEVGGVGRKYCFRRTCQAMDDTADMVLNW